jgi:hypothetical protein
MDRNEISNPNREPSMGTSYQVSVHLFKQFQRRRILEIDEGFLVVFDMRQCKITLKMSPALYQEEEEEEDQPETRIT